MSSEAARSWADLVVEAAPNAMLVLDAERHILLANRSAEALFGYKRGEMLGQSIDAIAPDYASDEGPRDGRAPSPRAACRGREVLARRKNGAEIYTEIGLASVETPSGPVEILSVVDVGKRRRAEAAQEHLAAIVESSEDAIISKALDGTITSWNRGAERLFGYSADETVGRSTTMLIPERLAANEVRLLEALRQSGRIARFETVRRRKDGSELDVSVTFSPIRNAAGDVVGESKIVHDISEFKRRGAELERSNAELEQFAYVASHDLQEPLRMVANYTELLAERYRGKLDERADKYIHHASDGARRMQRLVVDLLAYSRVGSQARPLDPVSSADVVRGVVKTLREPIDKVGATLDVGALPAVLADEVQLGQLFQNLVCNALKFRSDRPPHVIIHAAPEGNRWRFTVADNGIGFDMRYAERIFQMFQRLHERGKYEGSGIGLAIAKRIVERHGGRLGVESAPGVGTTFFFTLAAHPGGEW